MNRFQTAKRPRVIASVFSFLSFSMSVGSISLSAETSRSHIAIEKEVLVSGVKLQPKQLILASDGSIIVAGNSNHAGAAAMSSQGNLLWTYEDPTPPKNGVPEKSSYNGVVQLNNGNFLFCGVRGAGALTTNLVTILDKKGKLVGTRTESPGNDPSLIYSSLEKCVLFDNNVLLFGGVSSGTKGRYWVAKIDNNGKIITQSVFDFHDPVAPNSSETPSVIDAGSEDIRKNEFTAHRISFDGKVSARRTLEGKFPLVLRSEGESNVTGIVAYAQPGEEKAILYTLDKSLQDVAKPRAIDYFDMARGFGYRMTDGSVALFGRRRSLARNASVVWIPANGEPTQIREFENTYPSNSVEAGLATSSHEFLTARNAIRPGENLGLIISWITVR